MRGPRTLTQLHQALSVYDFREMLKREVKTRVGFDIEILGMDGMYAFVDETVDRISVHVRADKAQICKQIVRDLIAVTAVMQWLHSLTQDEEWSPYP